MTDYSGRAVEEALRQEAMGVTRIFQSAVHPADLEDVRRFFREDVKPAFEAADGCLGIDLAIVAAESTTGMVEGAAISRWETAEKMRAALESHAIRESQVRIRQLLRTVPVIQVFTVVD